MERHGYYDVFCIDVYDVFNKKNRIIFDLEQIVSGNIVSYISKNLDPYTAH